MQWKARLVVAQFVQHLRGYEDRRRRVPTGEDDPVTDRVDLLAVELALDGCDRGARTAAGHGIARTPAKDGDARVVGLVETVLERGGPDIKAQDAHAISNP